VRPFHLNHRDRLVAYPTLESGARAGDLSPNAGFTMPNPISPEAARARSKANFDTIATEYDGLRFVHRCATRLVELAPLESGMRVLDLATGTALVASLVAPKVRASGRVVGVDFSKKMLIQARARLNSLHLGWVELLEADAAQLPFADSSFECVLCASSLMFMPDMSAVLLEARRVLVPGGRLGFTGFGAGFLEPLHTLWKERLAVHGVPLPPLPMSRLADPVVCRNLLLKAGFEKVELHSEQLGYWLGQAEDRWQEIRVGLEGLPLSKMVPQGREQIELEHLNELRPLEGEKGLWVDLPVNFAFGTRGTSNS